MNKPKRIQLSRKKGWRLPENTVLVSRPHRWGNPYSVKDGYSRQNCVNHFIIMLAEGRTPPFTFANIRAELSGKNLACWCRIGEPCHADVLLEIANA